MLGEISSIFKGAVSKASSWAGSAIGGAIGGPTGAKVGSFIGSLLEKKPGAGQPFSPIDTSVDVPSYGGRMGSYAAGTARAPDVRMKTVDGETLNAEWEYRLTKGLRNRNLYT